MRPCPFSAMSGFTINRFDCKNVEVGHKLCYSVTISQYPMLLHDYRNAVAMHAFYIRRTLKQINKIKN